ncbi:hypothetical protein TKK_0006978 [Trichogramma kaykai]
MFSIFLTKSRRVKSRYLGNNNSASSQDSVSSPRKSTQQQHEVRCYCNQPHCVSQGYMCRGRGCFTELPPLALVTSSLKSLHLLHGRPETAGFSGCFDDKLNGGGNNVNGKISCPPGKLCCEQDLCNHVDSPALRARLNKTLQVLIGEHHQQNHLGGGGTSISSPSTTSQATGSQQQSEGWFRTLTIAVPICGFVLLLILASLAIRMLQPLPTQSDKLQGLQPPLLPPTATVTTTHHCHRHFRQHLAPNKMPLV